MRADAQRNLGAILEAARTAFAERGLEVGVADIAKRAGVGSATVFRRFPTKEALIAAVAEDGLREMIAVIDAAEARPRAWDGLRECMERSVELQIHDRGLCEIYSRGFESEPRVRELKQQLVERLEALLRRAKNEGDVRWDVDQVDFAVLLSAVARTGLDLERVAPGAWRRYLAIVLDGLRPGAPELTTPGLRPAQVERLLNAPGPAAAG